MNETNSNQMDDSSLSVEKTVAFSTIPIEKQNPTTLSDNEKGSHLSDLVGQDGLIDTLMDADTIDEILSTSIYNKPEIAIREVFNNALRQCRTAENLGAHPEINITFDVKKRRLIIYETDSMGMSVQTFKDVYRHTGRSGNLDGTESGQFGIGKKSYRAIADTMIFETYARETNEKYAFLTKGNKFEELPEPKLSTYGTRVSFAIKTEVKLTDLAKYVSTIARFTKINTHLEFLDDLYEHDDPEHRKYGVTFSKGKMQIGPVSEKEFLGKILDTENIEWVELDKPDYYLLGAFTRSYSSKEKRFCNLVGIPISLGEHENEYGEKKLNEIPNPGFDGYILNIKDERKYPPTASRDYLKEDSFKRLAKVIQEDLEEFYSKIDVKTIQDYAASSQKYFVEKLPYGGFDNVMSHSTINFNKLLELKVELFDNEPKDEGRYYRPKLGEIFEKDVQVLCNYNKTMRRINRVLEFSSNIVVIVPEGNKHERHSSLWIMEQAGIQTISEFMKAKNIKLPKNSSIGEVAVRFGGYSNGIEQMDLDDLDQFCIRIPKEKLEDTNIREYTDVLRDAEFTKFGMFRDQKKFEDTASITLEEFLRNTQKEEFETSEGILTGKEILKNYQSIVILRAHESKFENHLTFDFVKKETDADLVIVELSHKYTHPTKQQSLMLASNIIKGRIFKKRGAELDYKIASMLVEPLHIECDGKWMEFPEMAIKYLGEIKNSSIRELYALSYSKIFEYGKGWESKDKKDIKVCQELDELFKSLKKESSNNIMELSQLLFEKFQDAEYGAYQRKIRDIAKKIVIEGLKRISNEKKKYLECAKLLLKDKIKDGTLSVSIKKDSYKDKIIIRFETDQKIKLADDFAGLFNKVTDKYYSLDSVTVEGNKFEVVLD